MVVLKMKSGMLTDRERDILKKAIEKAEYRKANPTLVATLFDMLWPLALGIMFFLLILFMTNHTAQKGYFDLTNACSPFPEPKWFEELDRKKYNENKSEDDTPYTGNVSTGGAFGGMSGGSGMGAF